MGIDEGGDVGYVKRQRVKIQDERRRGRRGAGNGRSTKKQKAYDTDVSRVVTHLSTQTA